MSKKQIFNKRSKKHPEVFSVSIVNHSGKPIPLGDVFAQLAIGIGKTAIQHNCTIRVLADGTTHIETDKDSNEAD